MMASLVQRIGLKRFMLLFALLFSIAIVHVWSEARFVQDSYQLSRLYKEESALRAENEKLELEIATLRAPSTLSAKAIDDLGMIPPSPDQIVMIQKMTQETTKQ